MALPDLRWVFCISWLRSCKFLMRFWHILAIPVSWFSRNLYFKLPNVKDKKIFSVFPQNLREIQTKKSIICVVHNVWGQETWWSFSIYPSVVVRSVPEFQQGFWWGCKKRTIFWGCKPAKDQEWSKQVPDGAHCSLSGQPAEALRACGPMQSTQSCSKVEQQNTIAWVWHSAPAALLLLIQ